MDDNDKLDTFFNELCALCEKHKACILVKNNKLILSVDEDGTEICDEFGKMITSGGVS